MISKDQLLKRLQDKTSSNENIPTVNDIENYHKEDHFGMSQIGLSNNSQNLQIQLSQTDEKHKSFNKNFEFPQKRESFKSEKRAFQLPLQFTDKFFDEDPGLIRIENCQSQPHFQNMPPYFNQPDQEDFNNSNESFEVISSQIKLLSNERDYNDKCINKEEIMRRASQLTRVIDSQFTQNSVAQAQTKLYYPSIMTSPVLQSTSNIKQSDKNSLIEEAPVVRANHAVQDQFGQIYTYRSEGQPEFDYQVPRQLFGPLQSIDMNDQNNQHMRCMSTNENSIDNQGSVGYFVQNDTKNFKERNSKWVNQQNIRKFQIQQQCEENQMKECTFKPNTNNKSKKLVEYKRPSDQNRGEQLYEQKGKKKQETTLKYQRDEEEKMKKYCTFKPQLCEKDYAVQSRYKQLAEEIITNKVPLNELYAAPEILNYEQSQLKNCTFHPQIQGVNSKMQTASLYTSINAFERLSKPLNQLLPEIDVDSQHLQSVHGDEAIHIQKQGEESELQKIQKQLQTFGPNVTHSISHFQERNQNQQETLSEIQSHSHFTSKSQFQDALQQFNERQQKFLQDKELKRQKLEQSILPSYKPQINEISKYMTEEKSQDFMARNQILLEKIQKHQNESQPEEASQCTFQPQITRLAKQQRSKDVEELCYGDLFKKKKLIDQIGYQIQHDIIQQATFQPQLIAQQKNQDLANVRSKLGINDDLNIYIERQQREIERKKQEQEEQQKIKEFQELEGCTYQPKIKECPDYIKRIAEESKRIRGEREIIIEQFPAPKPEWKS